MYSSTPEADVSLNRPEVDRLCRSLCGYPVSGLVLPSPRSQVSLAEYAARHRLSSACKLVEK